jgi:solute carrier family 45 protein 1/2/4
MILTFAVNNVSDATLIVTSLGYSWAIATWVPFALIGQALNATPSRPNSQTNSSYDVLFETEPSDVRLDRDSTSRNIAYSSLHDGGPKMRGSKIDVEVDDIDLATEHLGEGISVSTGVILGIHNIYVVVPQLLTALLGFLLFALLPDESIPPKAGTRADSIGWLFRIGGIMAVFAAIMIRRLPSS